MDDSTRRELAARITDLRGRADFLEGMALRKGPLWDEYAAALKRVAEMELEIVALLDQLGGASA